MANNSNLIPFNKGYDARRGQKTKGSKHLSTRIRELLSDKSFEANVLDAKKGIVAYKGAPIDAIISVSITKAVNGDDKAREWLSKYGWGHKVELEQAGINKVIIETRKNTSISPLLVDDFNRFLKQRKSKD